MGFFMIIQLFLLLMCLCVLGGLVLYAIMGFGNNIGGSERRNKPLYLVIFFYSLAAIAITYLFALSSNSTSDIDMVAVPLFAIAYILSVISFFRFRSKKVNLPFFADLFFGMGMGFFMIYLTCELLQRYAFYKGNIGFEPVVGIILLQGLWMTINLAKKRG